MGLDECGLSAYHFIALVGLNFLSVNSTRKMLHLNITTGHNLVRFIDSKSAGIAPGEAPRYVKEMFRYLNPA